MKAVLRIGFLALAVMALAVPAHAGPLEDGWAAYEREDYAAALKYWRPLAERSDAGAQYNLGITYRFGRGVRQNYRVAAKWYRKAAEQGVADAQASLGLMYALGRGVPQDYVKAHMWLNLAAAQGDKSAQEGRDFAASLMTPGQIAKAQRMTREWLAKQDRQPPAAAELPTAAKAQAESVPRYKTLGNGVIFWKQDRRPSAAAELPAVAKTQAESVPRYKTLGNGVRIRVY